MQLNLNWFNTKWYVLTPKLLIALSVMIHIAEGVAIGTQDLQNQEAAGGQLGWALSAFYVGKWFSFAAVQLGVELLMYKFSKLLIKDKKNSGIEAAMLLFLILFYYLFTQLMIKNIETLDKVSDPIAKYDTKNVHVVYDSTYTEVTKIDSITTLTTEKEVVHVGYFRSAAISITILYMTILVGIMSIISKLVISCRYGEVAQTWREIQISEIEYTNKSVKIALTDFRDFLIIMYDVESKELKRYIKSKCQTIDLVIEEVLLEAGVKLELHAFYEGSFDEHSRTVLLQHSIDNSTIATTTAIVPVKEIDVSVIANGNNIKLLFNDLGYTITYTVAKDSMFTNIVPGRNNQTISLTHQPHTVNVNNLEKGKTYFIKINAKKGTEVLPEKVIDYTLPL